MHDASFPAQEIQKETSDSNFAPLLHSSTVALVLPRLSSFRHLPMESNLGCMKSSSVFHLASEAAERRAVRAVAVRDTGARCPVLPRRGSELLLGAPLPAPLRLVISHILTIIAIVVFTTAINIISKTNVYVVTDHQQYEGGGKIHFPFSFHFNPMKVQQ